MTTIETFFADIAGEPQPLLGRVTGRLLFEVRDRNATNRWLVSLDRGVASITVVDRAVDADAVIRGDRKLIDELVGGRANATAAMLRGDLAIEGIVELLVIFQRLFPGPPQRNRLDT